MGKPFLASPSANNVALVSNLPFETYFTVQPVEQIADPAAGRILRIPLLGAYFASLYIKLGHTDTKDIKYRICCLYLANKSRKYAQAGYGGEVGEPRQSRSASAPSWAHTYLHIL
jgi:hypothetical protein